MPIVGIQRGVTFDKSVNKENYLFFLRTNTVTLNYKFTENLLRAVLCIIHKTEMKVCIPKSVKTRTDEGGVLVACHWFSWV